MLRIASTLVLLLGLSGVQPVQAGAKACLDFAAVLSADGAVDLELVDELWINLATGRDSIYRLEVEAAAPVTAELATTWSEWEPDCL